MIRDESVYKELVKRSLQDRDKQSREPTNMSTKAQAILGISF